MMENNPQEASGPLQRGGLMTLVPAPGRDGVTLVYFVQHPRIDGQFHTARAWKGTRKIATAAD